MTLSITQRILCELHTVGAMNEQTGLSGKDIADLLDVKQAPARLVELRKAGYVKSSDRSAGAMRFWLTPAGETYAIESKHYASKLKQDQSPDANCDQANKLSENSYLNDIEDTRPIPEPQYDHKDVAFDQYTNAFVVEQSNDATITHCKTAQMPANLTEANTRIYDLIRQNTDLEYEIMTLTEQINLLTSKLETESTYRELKAPVGYLLGDSIVMSQERPLQLYSENDLLIAFDSLEKAKELGEKSCLESACDLAVYALAPVGHFKSRQVVDWVGA